MSGSGTPKQCIILISGDLSVAESGPIAAMRSLAAWLVERGHDVTVVGTWREKKPDSEALAQFYGNARIFTHRRYLTDTWHFAPAIFGMAGRLLFDRTHFVLDVHGVWLFNAIVLSMVSKFRRLRYFINLHGNLRPLALATNRTVKRTALGLFFRRWLSGAESVLALNDNECSEAAQAVPNATFQVIPNGIKAHPAGIEALRRKEVLFLGRINPIKNIEGLIEAFGLIKGLFPEWRLRIVGPAADADYAKQLGARIVRSNADGRIIFVGPAYGEEKESLFLTASVFALTSWSEGQPMAALEAMAHGLPVIVSEECSLDIPESCGRVCGCDAESIASALRDIFSLSTQERSMMGAAAVNFVSEQFSEDAVFTKRLELYFGKSVQDHG